jgi:hypothetical protein
MLLALGCGLAPVAQGGIADSPLPTIAAGKKTQHLYSIPGVINVTNLGTYVACTSTAKATEAIAVEVFDPFGNALNDVSQTSTAVVPGVTVLYGTGSAAALLLDRNLGIGTLHAGSARVLATSKSFICTAYISDRTGNPPTGMTYLTIVAKTSQKAAN